MPLIGTVTGSFTAGRRASAFSRDWSPSMLENDLKMWINPSDTTKTIFESGTNHLMSITDSSSVGTTININNTPTRDTEDSKEILNFDHASNEYLSTDPFPIADSGNHWAIWAGTIQEPNNSKDSIWSFDTAESPKRDYAISASNQNAFDGELDLDGLSSNRISSTAGNLITFTSGSPIAENTAFMILCYFDKSHGEIGVRINGSNAFTPETDYDNNLKTTAGMNIFRNRGSQSYGGKLFEFMVSDGQPGIGSGNKMYIEKAEGYIAHKWGLTSSLPVSHPYKNTAPTG